MTIGTVPFAIQTDTDRRRHGTYGQYYAALSFEVQGPAELYGLFRISI